jgi:hypothetical protein
MKKSLLGACALALVGAFQAGAVVQAQETGMASIHSWVKVGRKTCLVDHFHNGDGTGTTRLEAERAAITAWTEFTAWEYGDPWGRYSNAVSRKMTCSRDGSSWSCALEARPCRPY